MKPYREYSRVTPQAEMDEGEKLFRAALITQIHEFALVDGGLCHLLFL